MRVVIADDEEIARYMIRSLLEECPAGGPIEIVAEAENGVELLDSVERLRPDIAFVDIRMPEVDGLEAIRLGRERFPDVEWIILTSYAEFEYAREAVRLGASSYLLKPTQPAELAAVVERAAERIERKWWDRNASIRSAVATAHYLPAEPAAPAAPLRGRPWRGCLVAFDGPAGIEFGPEMDRIQAELERHCIRHGLNLALLQTRKRNLLVAMEGSEDPREMMGAATLESAAITMLSFESVDLAELCRDLAGWDRLLGLRLIRGIGRNFEMAGLTSLPAEIRDYGELLSLFAMHWRDADYSEAIRAVDRMELAAMGLVDEEGMSHLAAYASLLTGGGRAPGSGAFDELRRACRSRLSESEGQSDIIGEVMAYIDRHYMESMGIATIAERLGISANYLSTLFHRRTGQKLVAYIANQRMIRAKRLLLENPSMPVGEIAARVGHPNGRYFAQQFLRYAGCYPSQYRKTTITPPAE